MYLFNYKAITFMTSNLLDSSLIHYLSLQLRLSFYRAIHNQ